MKICIPLTLEIEYSQDLKDYKYLQIEGVYLCQEGSSFNLVQPILNDLNDYIETQLQTEVKELVYEKHFNFGG